MVESSLADGVTCEDTYAVTARTKIKRMPKRSVQEKAAVHAILDEGLICHVAFAVDGQQFCVPTCYARVGETLYLHGSAVSRMLKTLAGGVHVCVTVTLLDGLVLARAVFHHSMRYRSVMVFGTAQLVTEEADKAAALAAFVHSVVPHRNRDARQPTKYELKATTVLALPLDEVSAKVNGGWPADDKEDMELPVWAGVIPAAVSFGAPMADTTCTAMDLPVPDYASDYQRPGVL